MALDHQLRRAVACVASLAVEVLAVAVVKLRLVGLDLVAELVGVYGVGAGELVVRHVVGNDINDDLDTVFVCLLAHRGELRLGAEPTGIGNGLADRLIELRPLTRHVRPRTEVLRLGDRGCLNSRIARRLDLRSFLNIFIKKPSFHKNSLLLYQILLKMYIVYITNCLMIFCAT